MINSFIDELKTLVDSYVDDNVGLTTPDNQPFYQTDLDMVNNTLTISVSRPKTFGKGILDEHKEMAQELVELIQKKFDFECDFVHVSPYAFQLTYYNFQK